MKKLRRILAMAGIILLASMYILLLVFAVTGSGRATSWFRLCLGMTVAVPILLYIMLMFVRLNEKSNQVQDEPEKREEKL